MSVYQSGSLLAHGTTLSVVGLALYTVPKKYLGFFGMEESTALVEASRFVGSFCIPFGGSLVYASLGDEDEIKHASRNGLICSLLGLSLVVAGVLNPSTGSYPKLAYYFFIGYDALFALIHGFYAFNLRKYLPESDD